MAQNIIISGFADEIHPDLDVQLRVVKKLGMDHICLRAADNKGIADYSAEEFCERILPRLESAGVKISSLGSPIGKIGIEDEEGMHRQLAQLETMCQICKLSGTRYIRMFSFYMPKDCNPDDYTAQVLEKLTAFLQVARKYDVVLIHENEKGIYGDTGLRCRRILEELGGPNFRACFDYANFVQCGEDTTQCWEQLKEFVSYIHVKDALSSSGRNVVCGSGDGKIPQLLKQAIRKDGYTGFLTLEPHLAVFGSFKMLETDAAAAQAGMDQARNGEEGYAMQYHALTDILKTV